MPFGLRFPVPLGLWRAAQTGFEIRSGAEYEKQNAAIGRFNLVIFGKTGVGKSTLINAIFGGRWPYRNPPPGDKGCHLSLDKVGHLGIVDTQGLTRWARTTSRSCPSLTRP